MWCFDRKNKLEYMLCWQFSASWNVDDIKCKLCNEKYKRTLVHYISEWYVAHPFRLPRMRYAEPIAGGG